MKTGKKRGSEGRREAWIGYTVFGRLVGHTGQRLLLAWLQESCVGQEWPSFSTHSESALTGSSQLEFPLMNPDLDLSVIRM